MSPIFGADSDRLVGSMTVAQLDGRIGAERGNGVPSVAANATGRTRLWSTVGSWNTPSLRVLEKLGFHRDHVTMKDDGTDVVWLTRTVP